MSLKDTLTNEKLNKLSENQFSLVNKLIAVARIRLQRGEGKDSNLVNEVLENAVADYDADDETEEAV